ncbi:Ferredoxin-like protein FixX [Cellulomonas sp. T2.31MG-18]|uniref:ferredoxin family protein n=1 Tax=Cellulomonas sp. T2.31MG-18 TaxID=3157619 RepID=UPI0035ED4C44
MQLGTVPERLARNQYDVDEGTPHIEVHQDVVRRTGAAPLLVRICPAHVYTAEPDGSVGFTAAACLECGTCLAVAPEAVSWHYPRGGFGVAYRQG